SDQTHAVGALLDTRRLPLHIGEHDEPPDQNPARNLAGFAVHRMDWPESNKLPQTQRTIPPSGHDALRPHPLGACRSDLPSHVSRKSRAAALDRLAVR